MDVEFKSKYSDVRRGQEGPRVRAASFYPYSVSVQAAGCFPSGEVRNDSV